KSKASPHSGKNHKFGFNVQMPTRVYAEGLITNRISQEFLSSEATLGIAFSAIPWGIYGQCSG
ncbi:MAG: hypothetical protein EBZ48_14895, partial [Proteobacteria bacterium]|nr:hypothetical protein [Pseudomonadota bacterium]